MSQHNLSLRIMVKVFDHHYKLLEEFAERPYVSNNSSKIRGSG